MLKPLDFFPLEETVRLERFSRVCNRIGKDILRKKESGEGLEDTTGDKDVLSLLIRANLAEDPKKKLSSEEVTAQLSYVLPQNLRF